MNSLSSKKQLFYSKRVIVDNILKTLDSRFKNMTYSKKEFNFSSQKYFIVDNVLPKKMALNIYNLFPSSKQLILKKNRKEKKYIGVELSNYSKQIEAIIFAFQDPRVLKKIESITGLKNLEADPELYAGGVSLMDHGCFLNPHLDNSHNHDRTLFRVLNLLYYVSPNWKAMNGGNLELWAHKPDGIPRTIVSKFNRLVVMSTGINSWHSVSKVLNNNQRCCISNYYFSKEPFDADQKFRITTFRGRPEQIFINALLTIDSEIRQFIRLIRPSGIFKTLHIYKKTNTK
jgi:Rps23 Pro-64 3,4-dihydroxylase Tpa1-like proline 4-hydroxylase